MHFRLKWNEINLEVKLPFVDMFPASDKNMTFIHFPIQSAAMLIDNTMETTATNIKCIFFSGRMQHYLKMIGRTISIKVQHCREFIQNLIFSRSVLFVAF